MTIAVLQQALFAGDVKWLKTNTLTVALFRDRTAIWQEVTI